VVREGLITVRREIQIRSSRCAYHHRYMRIGASRAFPTTFSACSKQFWLNVGHCDASANAHVSSQRIRPCTIVRASWAPLNVASWQHLSAESISRTNQSNIMCQSCRSIDHIVGTRRLTLHVERVYTCGQRSLVHKD
jgi:hypothetical protein